MTDEVKLVASTALLVNGHYMGVLIKDRRGEHRTDAYLWRCGHEHPRRIGDDLQGRETPVWRSAQKCAEDELARRAAR